MGSFLLELTQLKYNEQIFSKPQLSCYNHSRKLVPRVGGFNLLRISIMNDKVLIISILSLLGIGFIAVLFVAVPWLINYALPDWENTLLDSGIVIVAIVLFVYGFYMNTRMH
jgi:apolipoprotein N-acyltransferase